VYDPGCHLCPRNTRTSGIVNPDYQGVFVFDNDHPSVSMSAPAVCPGPAGALYRRSRATGVSRVLCYDPRHNVSLPDLKVHRVAEVFAVWRAHVRELATLPGLRFALIFENRGEIVGVSNPHPHCQIYGTNFVFRNIETEMEAMRLHRETHRSNIFEDILGEEQRAGARIVAENDDAVAFIPFFARYAYEALLFPKARHSTMASMSDAELYGLAEVYCQLTRRYDRLYGCPFPYVMTIYQAPLNGGNYEGYHLHLQFLPPLRQRGLQKFPAGPEIGGGNFMAETIPEQRARVLRDVDISTFAEIS
jgi:UDPglucose--hexose-1-phosphate uridylyltransferase